MIHELKIKMIRNSVDFFRRWRVFPFLFLFHFLFYITSLFFFFQGKRLVFVTNNSTKSRKQYGKKFETLGLTVTEVSVTQSSWVLPKILMLIVYGIQIFQEEIFASSFAAAAYLKSIDFPKEKKVLALWLSFIMCIIFSLSF